MDYKKYAAVDRTALLEVLISRGMYQQAMSIVSQIGYEGIRIESQLKLTSRMLTRCEMEEDDELLALASDVYRRGKYDEVILKYLMEYRFGPVDELISVCLPLTELNSWRFTPLNTIRFPFIVIIPFFISKRRNPTF